MHESALLDAIARQGRLVRKELTEILRDRRTIVTLVLMPLLVYPLLSVGFVQFFRAMTPIKEMKFVVGFEDADALRTFQRIESEIGPKLKANDWGKTPSWIVVDFAPPVDAALKSGEIDVAISRSAVEGKTESLRATYLKKSNAGALAAMWLDRLLNMENGRNLDALLKRTNSPEVRFDLVRTIVATDEGDGMMSLSSVIPFILILMTITGAVYPAIDLTAGERERGTLEILVAAPVPRLNVLIAKYAAVVFVAVLTALVNLTAMTATMMINPIGQQLLGSGGLTPLICLQLFCLLLLFAMFFSAVLLTITSFARSFKEAQAYLIPVMLVAMAPGAASLVPDLKLSPGLAVTPMVNIVLLGRDLLDGKANPAIAALVVISTLLYAAAALALAARVFGAEGVLYNERNSWGDLVRRPHVPRDAATPGTALWSLALMTPTFFLLEGLLNGMLPRLTGRLHWSPIAVMQWGVIVLSIILFVGVPALFAWHERVRWRTGFGLGTPAWHAWLAAILLGGSIWAVMMPLLEWLRPDVPAWLGELAEQMGEQLRQNRGDLRALIVVSFVVQAVVEEFFFRGYLWSALERPAGTLWTLLATSLLFGLAHVVTGGMLGVEKLLPTTILGLLLGFVRWRTGSVLPGMALHAGHNAILALLGQNASSEWSEFSWSRLFGALVAITIGLAILVPDRRRAEPRQRPG